MYAPVWSVSFQVLAIIVNSPAQLRKVLMGGGGDYSDLSEKNTPLINGLELEHSTGTP